MKGRLIVFEGTDGSGKSTQFSALCRRAEGEGLTFDRLIFPRYDLPSCTLVNMYLRGEFGTRPSDVNAYAASTFYAVDRYAAYKQEWGEGYRRGGLVLSDRYTTSNAVHQASKLPPEERPAFWDWLFDLEYGKLELPRPDLVIWLDMPIDRAIENIRRREQDTNTRGDIHEVDTGYLSLCAQTAAQAAEYCGWDRVSCVKDGQLRPVEDIHEEIWDKVRNILTDREG